MLIVSKFRDFYDSIAYQKGIDKTIVYQRELKEMVYNPDKELSYTFNKIADFPYYASYEYSNPENRDVILKTFIIGFCGKIYPICKRTDFVKNPNSNSYDKLDRIESYVFELDNIKSMFYNIEKIKRDSWYKNRIDKEFAYLEDFINRPSVLELFFTYKTPIFKFVTSTDAIKRGENFVLNPILKDIEFYKCMDTYQIFQELEMYISGVLGVNEPPVIEISEKDKVASKGFDKFSFRKEPGTKKRGKNK